MSARTPCYHVETTDGQVYGAAAHGKREAKTMVQERLTREWDETPIGDEGHETPTTPAPAPTTAEKVAMWEADYGTVLHYGPIP